MRINETKKGNMSVHEAINVLLWYCQEIKKNTFEEKNRNSNEHRLVLFYLEGLCKLSRKNCRG